MGSVQKVIASVFWSRCPIEFTAIRKIKSVSPANKMKSRKRNASAIFTSLSLRIPRLSPNQTLSENRATQTTTTATSRANPSGKPVSLETKADISGVEIPRELPAPPMRAIMKKLSIRRASQERSLPLSQYCAELLYFSCGTLRT